MKMSKKKEKQLCATSYAQMSIWNNFLFQFLIFHNVVIYDFIEKSKIKVKNTHNLEWLSSFPSLGSVLTLLGNTNSVTSPGGLERASS